MLEFQLFDRLIAKIRGGMPDNTDDAFEEKVKKVKHEIAYEVCKAKSQSTIHSVKYIYLASVTGEFLFYS